MLTVVSTVSVSGSEIQYCRLRKKAAVFTVLAILCLVRT